MDRNEFFRKVKRIGKQQNIKVWRECKRGKGSHETLYYGQNDTILKKGEQGTGLIEGMLRDLGIPKKLFNNCK